MPELETTHLKLPYIAAAQAQKHVTHNEALRLLDSVVQLAILDSTLAEPPAEPADGDRYIVAADATGAWDGRDGDVATWVDGAWMFATAEDGWLAFDRAAEALLVRLGGVWTPLAAGGGGIPETVEQLGVNATADETNRLAVRSEAVLFSGIEDAEGGSGDIRFVVNKETDGDTASLLFQSGWSGRAEVGLVGDTDFVFKVSADGESWIDAIRIDKDTGLATILYDNAVSGLTATTVQDAIDEVAAGGGGGGGAVVSVFGRTGAVAAAAGDYDAGEIDNDSGVAGATVKDALDALASAKQAADADLSALAALSGTGIAARTATDTWAVRSIAGTANRITLTNGDGVSGNPTVDIASAYVGQATITTLGTIGTGTWQATAVGVAFGGTGQTSYTNGQLLIGNSTGNTLAKGTLTAPAAGISIANGAGSITFGLADDLAALEAMAGSGLVARTAANTYAQRSVAVTASTGLSVSNGDGVSGNPTLAGIDATTSAKGVAEFATAAEYRTGTDTARALAVSEVWSAAALAALSDGANIAVDLAAGFNFGGASNAVLALGGNRTLSAPSNLKTGQTGILWFGASGATRTLTLNAAWVLCDGVEAGPYSITTAQELGVAYWVRGSKVYVTTILRCAA
jgi:hypothetical protein